MNFSDSPPMTFSLEVEPLVETEPEIACEFEFVALAPFEWAAAAFELHADREKRQRAAKPATAVVVSVRVVLRFVLNDMCLFP